MDAVVGNENTYHGDTHANHLNDDHCSLELITPIKSWKNDKYASKYVIGGDENDPQPCNLQSFNLNLFLLLTILLTFFILNVLVR